MEFVKRCTSGCKTNYLDGMDLMVIEAVAAVAQWAIKVNKIAIMKKTRENNIIFEYFVLTHCVLLLLLLML